MGNETQTQTKVERVLNGKTVTEKYADVTLRLIEEHGDHVAPLTPEHAAKVKRKLYLRLMGLLSMINIMLFVRFIPQMTDMATDKWCRLTSPPWDMQQSLVFSKRRASLRLNITT